MASNTSSWLNVLEVYMYACSYVALSYAKLILIVYSLTQVQCYTTVTADGWICIFRLGCPASAYMLERTLTSIQN